MATIINMGRIAIKILCFTLIGQLCNAQSWPTPLFNIKERDAKTKVQKDIYTYLEKDVTHYKNNECTPLWGLFYFRVNATGKIDSVHYEGTLANYTKKDIIRNIHSTKGHWRIPKNVSRDQKIWFIYPYFEFGYKHYINSDCSDIDKELQKNLIGISNQFSRIAYMNRNTKLVHLVPYKQGGPFDEE